jgi:hypothetical protein
MKVCLLYAEKDWDNTGHYFEENAVIQDLGLKTIFQAASKEIELEDGKVKQVREADPYIQEVMKKVMMVPLHTKEEIRYRQEILKDCLKRETFICQLYQLSTEILARWDKLGRRGNQRTSAGNSTGSLITEAHVLNLFVTGLSELKALFAGEAEAFQAEGVLNFYERLCQEFSEELETNLRKVLKDISFFANEKEHGEITTKLVEKPRIVFGCSMGDGLKPDAFRLEAVSTQLRKHRAPDSTIGRAQEYFNALSGDAFSIRKEEALSTQAVRMEHRVVRHLMLCCTPFMDAFRSFFDQLRFQAAFYRGAITLKHYMERFHIHACFPKVGKCGDLRFAELRELVMGIEQRIEPVGNTCVIEDKMLLIVTGANQGGKSTFLRSIGIAQVMLQSGLMVAAEEFESGIFPSVFTHFTRREDSEMNSGRLDEELGRMSGIVDHLDAKSLVLLNESFASTTEKEGSVIAYDIVRALKEAGVKVLTVTHLLSFAQRMYEESARGECSGVEFLTALRMENGRRTFKMIRHAPELTSFGLDLYEELIGH